MGERKIYVVGIIVVVVFIAFGVVGGNGVIVLFLHVFVCGFVGWTVDGGALKELQVWCAARDAGVGAVGGIVAHALTVITLNFGDGWLGILHKGNTGLLGIRFLSTVFTWCAEWTITWFLVIY